MIRTAIERSLRKWRGSVRSLTHSPSAPAVTWQPVSQDPPATDNCETKEDSATPARIDSVKPPPPVGPTPAKSPRSQRMQEVLQDYIFHSCVLIALVVKRRA